MIFYSKPIPNIGWWRPTVAVAGGVLGPALLGAVWLWFAETSITGPPKDGSSRDIWQHLVFVAAALTAAPILSWIAIPLATPLARLAVIRGWAGWGSAVAVACGLGLLIVHFALNGDMTTESPATLPHIVVALGLQGSWVWLILQLWSGRLDDTTEGPTPHK